MRYHLLCAEIDESAGPVAAARGPEGTWSSVSSQEQHSLATALAPPGRLVNDGPHPAHAAHHGGTSPQRRRRRFSEISDQLRNAQVSMTLNRHLGHSSTDQQEADSLKRFEGKVSGRVSLSAPLTVIERLHKPLTCSDGAPLGTRTPNLLIPGPSSSSVGKTARDLRKRRPQAQDSGRHSSSNRDEKCP
jgi:hypothetical protein